MEKTNYLFDKSQENIKSATLLIEKEYSAASVHCSYYSCIQIMLHVLRSDFKKSEEDITQESDEGSRDSHGFHNWIQNYLFKEVSNREKDARIALDFYNLLGSLKGIRIRADYKINVIGKKEASKALEGANKINKIITERFIT